MQSSSGVGRHRPRRSQSKMRVALEKMNQESRSLLGSGDPDSNVRQTSLQKATLKKKKLKATTSNPKLIVRALLLFLGVSYLSVIVYFTYREFSPSPWSASIINTMVKRRNDARIPLINWLTRLNDAKSNAVRKFQNIIGIDPGVEEPAPWRAYLHEGYSKIRSTFNRTLNRLYE